MAENAVLVRLDMPPSLAVLLKLRRNRDANVGGKEVVDYSVTT